MIRFMTKRIILELLSNKFSSAFSSSTFHPPRLHELYCVLVIIEHKLSRLPKLSLRKLIKMEDINIREARKEDMFQVHALIKGLAEFESMSDQVKITPEILIADGFSASPAFGCFVAAVNDTTIVGYAIYYHSYSTWVGKSIFLEDIFVNPEQRKRGIGKQLFLKVAELAHKCSKRMDFHVLAWNPASNFYKSLGSVNLTEIEQWNTYRLCDAALDKHFLDGVKQ